MDNQTAFNIVVQHLRTQGAQSLGSNGKDGGSFCFYRHPDGIKRCAVGVLISDEHYSPSLENFSISHVYDSLPCLRGVSLDLLNDLQCAHDKDVPDWLKHMENQYKVIANRYKLTIPTHPLSEVATSVAEKPREEYIVTT